MGLASRLQVHACSLDCFNFVCVSLTAAGRAPPTRGVPARACVAEDSPMMTPARTRQGDQNRDDHIDCK